MVLTGQFEGKKDRGKQPETYLMRLSKWIVEHSLGEIAKNQNLLRATRDKKMWRAIIACILKGHGT